MSGWDGLTASEGRLAACDHQARKRWGRKGRWRRLIGDDLAGRRLIIESMWDGGPRIFESGRPNTSDPFLLTIGLQLGGATWSDGSS